MTIVTTKALHEKHRASQKSVLLQDAVDDAGYFWRYLERRITSGER